MQLGVFLALFGNANLKTALDFVQAQEVSVVEVGTGNYPGDSHCQPASLIRSKAKREEWLEQFGSLQVIMNWTLRCNGLMPITYR